MGVGARLAALTPNQVAGWAAAAQLAAAEGQVNSRISTLALCPPDWFGLQIDASQTICTWGNHQQPFALMSLVKPFLLLYLLERYGFEQVFTWVGFTPSDRPFNDLDQLKADGGHPRNPMINSGALMLAGQLVGQEPVDDFRDWLNQQAGCQLAIDAATLKAVRRGRRDANLALLGHLAATDRLQHPAQALDTYERICCLSGTVADLAQLGSLLAFEAGSVQAINRQAVNALMLTCGLYEASAHQAVAIGLPMKSGISGALLAVVPGQGAIATYGPALDSQGNSVAGLRFVAQITRSLGLSIFG